MTKGEMELKMEDLRTRIEENVDLYNKAFFDNNMEETKRLDSVIKDDVNEYTGVARQKCFTECAESEDPMLEAVKRLTFRTISVRDKKEDDITTREVVFIDKPIDSLKLHKFVPGGIGKDKNWSYMIEKLNFLMTADVCRDLKIDPASVNDSYAMAKISRDIDLGKTPTSKTHMLQTLNTIIAAMIGDGYKALTYDVNYLHFVYTKKGKKGLSVSCADHRYMRQYIMEICNRIVTGGVYNAEWKVIKTK